MAIRRLDRERTISLVNGSLACAPPRVDGGPNLSGKNHFCRQRPRQIRLLRTTGGSTAWRWVLGFGGPGVSVVALIDNSVIPIQGGMEFFVILHAPIIAIGASITPSLAVIGALIGGCITCRLAKKKALRAIKPWHCRSGQVTGSQTYLARK
jgi:hypothetical protein